MWDALARHIEEVIKKHIPQKWSSPKTQHPFINQELKRLMRRRDKYYHKSRTSTDPSIKHHAKVLKAQVQRETRKAFMNYVNDIIIRAVSESFLPSRVASLEAPSRVESRVSTKNKSPSPSRVASLKVTSRVESRVSRSRVESSRKSLRSESDPSLQSLHLARACMRARAHCTHAYTQTHTHTSIWYNMSSLIKYTIILGMLQET
jgi:hypothetical protein